MILHFLRRVGRLLGRYFRRGRTKPLRRSDEQVSLKMDMLTNVLATLYPEEEREGEHPIDTAIRLLQLKRNGDGPEV